MKKLVITLSVVLATASASFAQGVINFGNGATTLISAGGASMPGSNTRAFNFAVFMAPSTTVVANSLAPALNDAAWQTVAGVNVNHATAVGRLATTASALVVNGFTGGSTVDFIVRGWSANAGATWAAALAFYNNGAPSQDMWIGSSRIADNLVLGDGAAIGTPTLFGVGANQVVGFDQTFVSGIVPEPSSMAIAGLGAASLLLFRRRK